MLEDSRGVLTDFVSTSKYVTLFPPEGLENCRQSNWWYFSRAVFQSLVDKHFPAFDRRKTYDIIGLTDAMNEEMEAAALEEDPDEVDGVTGRPSMCPGV